MTDTWEVTIRVTPPATVLAHHRWQVDEVLRLRRAGAPQVIVAQWAAYLVLSSVPSLQRQAASRQN